MDADDRSSLILEMATEGFWDWDLKTDRYFLSPRYCELIGYSPDETVFDSTFFRSIIHPDDSQRVLDSILMHLAGKSAMCVVEYRMLCRDGTVRWIEGRGKAVAFSTDGSPTRMVGTISDISSRKDTDNRLMAVLSACPGIIVARFDREMRHQYVSPAVAELTGIPHDKFIGHTNRDLGMPEQLTDKWETAIGRVWETEQPQQIEFRFTAPDGMKCYQSYLAPEYSDDGSMKDVFVITQDCTDRIRAEETLIQSRNLLERLSARVPGIIFEARMEADERLRIVYASEKCHEIYELSPEDICRDITLIFDRFHPDDRGKVMDSILASGRTCSPWECEYRVVLPRQGTKWLYGTASTEPLEGGGVLWQGIIVDVSERMKAEETLRLSERKYATIFHTSPNAIVLTRRRDGLIMEVNEGFTEITGYSNREAVGRSTVDLLLWVDATDRERLETEFAAHGIVRSMECRSRRKDGATIHVLLDSCPIEIDNEPCLFTIIRDITELERTLQALRESEENLRTILDAIPVGIAISDGTTIEYLNSNFVRQFGYAHAEIPTDAAWFSRAYPDLSYREPLVAAWKSALDASRQSGVPVPTFEARVTCKDGSIRQTLANTRIIGSRLLVIFTDITEHESLQRELQKVQRLESLGVLAGGIAHDFNNILTAIMGNISFARMIVDQSHPVYRSLERAERASVRAADLARQLLVFAKGGEPVTRVIDLPAILNETVSLALTGTNVKARFDISPSLPAVEADEGQLAQCFHNIVINSVHAMPRGGWLDVHGESVLLGDRNSLALPAGTYVLITIADEGCGIPEEDLKRIFDPYFTTKAGGTGLGLASTHAIITRHRGRITVSSTVGAGSSFSIYLPAASAVPSGETPPAAPVSDNRGEGAVLVMDDDEMVRDLAVRALSQAGFAATTSEDGDQAVALYRAARDTGTPFDVTVLDLTVPGRMGGAEAARRILAIDPSAVLILSSGYPSHPVMVNFREYGFRFAIRKPYGIDEMISTIRAARNGASASLQRE